MELLSQVDRQVHLVVLHSPRERWRLPPGFHPIDRVLRRMHLFRVLWIAVIAYLSLNEIDVLVLISVRAYELAV